MKKDLKYTEFSYVLEISHEAFVDSWFCEKEKEITDEMKQIFMDDIFKSSLIKNYFSSVPIFFSLLDNKQILTQKLMTHELAFSFQLFFFMF